jgi:hypothetical protein
VIKHEPLTPMIVVVHLPTLFFSFSFLFRASAAKAKTDASAFMCKICRQTFMVNAKTSLLYLHVTSKHDDKKDDPTACFDSLAGFDPADPDGKNATTTTVAAPVKPKKVVKKDDDLSLLLDAGLKKGKK